MSSQSAISQHPTDAGGTETPQEAASTGSATDAELDSVLRSFKYLVQVVSDHGRDWKLLDALLQTMIEMILETRGDLLASAGGDAQQTHESSAATASADSRVKLQPRLRPEYRLRLEAVIDSLSDDETADFLCVSPRQVRRRAQQRSLYYFVVNRRRRYPWWQFESPRGVLSGAAEIGWAFPATWPPERIDTFLTTRSEALEMATPFQWLLKNREPGPIITLIGESEGIPSSSDGN